MAGLCCADEIDNLIEAIGQVESGNCDYPKGSNDNGLAKGRYQIHKAYWQDGTEYLKVNWPYEDAHKPDKARKVVRAYFARYGKDLTIKELAYLHNAGPNWRNIKTTEKYWKKVEKNIKK